MSSRVKRIVIIVLVVVLLGGFLYKRFVTDAIMDGGDMVRPVEDQVLIDDQGEGQGPSE